MLAGKGVAMVDAPVSGGMEGAQTRELLAMAGGEPAAFERAHSLLDAIAKRVIYTGGIETGSIAKIMHNSASFTLDLVMAEGWTVGVKAGIDTATIINVFNEAALEHKMSLKVRLPPPGCAAISTRAFRWPWRARSGAGARTDARHRHGDASRCNLGRGNDRGDRPRLGRSRRLDLSDAAGGAREGSGPPAARLTRLSSAGAR